MDRPPFAPPRLRMSASGEWMSARLECSSGPRTVSTSPIFSAVPEHLDIAGVADVEKPGGWRTRGCSGFGARLLADFAVGFGS